MNNRAEQHSIPVSNILHLLPGILTGIVFVAAAPFAKGWTFRLL